MTLENKIITIFGGSGFIGSHLCDALIKENPKKLIIFDNLSASTIGNIKHLLSDKRVQFINGDIRLYDEIASIIKVSDFIFHLGASCVGSSLTNPRENLESNILGTFNILDLAVQLNPIVRIIYASSGSIISQATPYAISKLAAENYCNFYAKEKGLKITSLRYHHVYGPRQSIKNGLSGVINIFLNLILQGKPPVIFGEGDAIKNFTNVSDIVKANLLVALNDDTIGKVYDVASDIKVSIKKLAESLIEKYAEDKNMKAEYGEKRIGEINELFPNTAAIKELGWKAEVEFEEGLEQCKKWVEEQL